MRRLLYALMVGVLGLVAAPAASPANTTIMQFNAGVDALRSPTSITRGPDGNLWYTARNQWTGTGAIGRMTRYAAVTEFTAGLGPNSKPNAITPSLDGNLWFTDPGNDTVGRMTTQGAVTQFSVARPGARLESLSAAIDGNVWFTDSGSPARIGRVTPSGAVTSFTAGLAPNARPTGIAAGPDGNLWFTERGNGGRIGRITLSGEVTEFSAGLTPGVDPLHIALGPDGNLWFTETNGRNGIGRITPSGVITEFTAGLTPDVKPFAIATGWDGNLWFTAEDNPDAIGRISPDGVIRLFRSGLNRGSKPEGIVAGPDGAMWFTAPGASLIGRIDPGLADGAEDAALGLSGSTKRLPPGVTPPAVGRSVVVQVVSGRVLAQRPGRGPVRLVAGATLPVNTVLDTRAGRLRLSAALPGGRTYQTAELWGARFAIAQQRNGMTDIYMREPLGCVAGLRKAAISRRRRTLWARDRRGRFRTHGRNSVATVRGTAWSTTERCDGTHTWVAEGAVSVRDVRKRRTVLLRAGHGYLARRR